MDGAVFGAAAPGAAQQGRDERQQACVAQALAGERAPVAVGVGITKLARYKAEISGRGVGGDALEAARVDAQVAGEERGFKRGGKLAGELGGRQVERGDWHCALCLLYEVSAIAAARRAEGAAVVLAHGVLLQA